MKMGKTTQYFSAYFLDNRLLIQFIVAEFLAAYSQVYYLKQKSHLLSSSPALFDELLPQITQSITTLQGVPHENSRPWSYQWRTGSLTKLKKYCEQLSANSFHQNKIHFQMHKHIYRAWICCLHCFEMVKVSQPPPSPFTSTFKPILASPLHHSLISMNTSLTNASKLLLKALRPFVDDETVLFFLHKRQQELTAIYGPDVFSHFVSPKKIDLLKKFKLNRSRESLIHSL